MSELIERDFTQAAQDGYLLSMRMISSPAPTLAVLVSSGTGYPKGFYDRYARWMAQRGAAVLTYDYRGIAASRPEQLKGSNIDFSDWGRRDMPAALQALIEAAPGLPVTHVAHSVGGHFLGLMPNQDLISRHAFVSVGTGWFGGHLASYRPVALAFWFLLGPFSLLRHGYIKGRLWGGTDLPPQIYKTWRRWSMKRAYFTRDFEHGLKPQHYSRVQAPIRSWVFSDDPIATPSAAQDLLSAYPSATTEIRHLTPNDLGLKRIAHDGAFRKGSEALWQEIHDWLGQGLPPSLPTLDEQTI